MNKMNSTQLLIIVLLMISPQLSAEPGQLKLNSNPPGAVVYLDGKELGTTPYSGAVEPGEHLLLLELEGHRQLRWQQIIPEGGVIDRDFTLRKKTSVLRLTSRPATANVILDGKHQGRTPLDLEVTAGKHELVLDLKGYVSRKEKFDAWDGGMKELEIKLRSKLKTIQKFELGFLAGAGAASLISIWSSNRYNRLVEDYGINNAYYERSVSQEEQLRYLSEIEGIVQQEERYANIRDMALVTSIGCATAAFLLYCYEDDHFYKFMDRFVLKTREDATVIAARLEF